MSIKQNGGVFGRNPTFNDVTIEGQLTFDGDIDINSDLKVAGDIETTGNVIIATSGKGIDFSATSGTGTSELLDDYEEGTWTPAIVGGTQTVSAVNNCKYTKTGRLVTLNAYFTLANVTDATEIVISGLPFTSGGYNNAGIVNLGNSDNSRPVLARAPASATTISLFYCDGVQVPVTQTVLQAHIIFTLIYYTA